MINFCGLDELLLPGFEFYILFVHFQRCGVERNGRSFFDTNIGPDTGYLPEEDDYAYDKVSKFKFYVGLSHVVRRHWFSELLQGFSNNMAEIHTA